MSNSNSSDAVRQQREEYLELVAERGSSLTALYRSLGTSWQA